MELNFMAPGLKNGEKVVLVTNEEIASGLKTWENALVGCVWGPIPSPDFVISRDKLIMDKLIEEFLDLEWRKYGNVKFHSKDLGIFLFDFESSEAKQTVLDKGVWYLERKSLALVLKPWTPDFNWGEKGVKSIPIWIKLPNLKLHLWTAKVLSKIASAVGRPLVTDKITASRERIDYARICVEVLFDRTLIKLPCSVTIEDEKGRSYVQEVQYEWLPCKCLRCKEYWHPNSDCPALKGSSLPNSSDVCNLQNLNDFSNLQIPCVLRDFSHPQNGSVFSDSWNSSLLRNQINNSSNLQNSTSNPQYPSLVRNSMLFFCHDHNSEPLNSNPQNYGQDSVTSSKNSISSRPTLFRHPCKDFCSCCSNLG